MLVADGACVQVACVGRRSGLDYVRTSALAFTSAGNIYELAIAVAASIWVVASQQALAGVIGPPIEVPVPVSLVYLRSD